MAPASAPGTIVPLGPLVAALILLFVIGGWGAVTAFLGRIVHWRIGIQWYLIVFLLPPAISALAAAINILLGAAVPQSWEVPGIGAFTGSFVFILLFIGLGEEPAWRGFALPRVLTGRTALAASVVLGHLHILWHLPLFGIEYDAKTIWPWAIGVVSFAIIVTWIWKHTEGSLLLPMIFHTMVNSTNFPFRVFTGGELLWLWWIFAALWLLAAAAVVTIYGCNLSRMKAAANNASAHDG